MKQEELITLIDALLDDSCSEADFLRLEAELHVNAQARQVYYERLKLHTYLHTESQGYQPATNIIPLRRKSHIALAWVSSFAALLLIALIVSWSSQPSNKPQDLALQDDYPENNTNQQTPNGMTSIPLGEGFGVIEHISAAQWKNQTIQTGDLVPQGLVQLESGMAQIELFSGVSLLIEGAAEFELHSDMEMTLKSGKIRALVPEPARGFRVKTTTGDVVDLGTEFALEVSNERADMHVLQGEIEWHPTQQPKESLLDGDSLSWLSEGKKSQSPRANWKSFPGFSHLRKERASHYEDWLQYRDDTLLTHPALLSYYSMNQVRGTKALINDASIGQDGTIVRANRTSDRWGKTNSALDFSPMGSRVRTHISGTHSSLTLACWVKIDSLDRQYNSLFLTDGHELHEPHWQIMNDGRMFFSIRANDLSKPKLKSKNILDKHIAYSPPIWSPAQSGQWMHLVTVYNHEDTSTTHYCNGQVISKDTLPSSLVPEAIEMGAASIGNWSEPIQKNPQFEIRNLNGAIDDFFLLNTALSSEEVAEIYHTSKP